MLKGNSSNQSDFEQILHYLEEKFTLYQTDNLKHISVKEFRSHLYKCLEIIDAEIEGYSEYELNQQRDLSIKFHWGHDHDFGEFKLEGRMKNRHLEVLSNFIVTFNLSIDQFNNKQIWDIGCWTGGTSLILAALGGQVHAIEEVVKYCQIVNFLGSSFGLEKQLKAAPVSLYECNSSDYHDRFDIAYFPGVIYHLSDPVVALRIIYNALRIDGIILVESGGINTDEPFCSFEGSRIYSKKGSKEDKSRGGWNWFKPSPEALRRMMIEAGFDNVITFWNDDLKRLYGYGKKMTHKGICKAGLSVKEIK